MAQSYELYCLKCRKKTVHYPIMIVQNGRKVPKIEVLPNGQKVVRVSCSICGTRNIKFLSAKGLKPVSAVIGQKRKRKKIDDDELERIYKVCRDLGVYKASTVLNIPVRTLYRYLKKYEEKQKADIVYIAEEFSSPKRHQEFIAWLKNQTSTWKDVLSFIKKVWLEVWNKKHLDLLTEDDIIKARNYINENYKKSKFNRLVALRYLIRFGFGKPEWLERHLKTKGTKGKPKIPPFLKLRGFYENTLPYIIQDFYNLPDLELKVIFLLKMYSGIRTGKANEERGLWGIRVGEGKSYVYLHNGDILIHVFEKFKEEWDIQYLPKRVWVLIRELARQRRHGEYLIQNTTPEKAIKILRKIFAKHGIEYKVDLHTLRKIALSLYYIAGVGLEDAVDINVGWTTIQTAKDHYKGLKGLALSRKEREELVKKLDLEHLRKLSWVLD